MGGAGTKVAVAGSVLGDSLSMKYLEQICAHVDDPNSTMAQVFDMDFHAADQAKAACSSSESCLAAADLAQSALKSVSSWVSSVWNGAGQAADAISNKAKVWYLEEKVRMLKEQIKDSRAVEEEFRIVIQHIKGLRTEAGLRMLNEEWDKDIKVKEMLEKIWMVNEWPVVEEKILVTIFTFEKELEENEARLLELGSK